ncbi:hypothetical protein ACHAXT_008008 [Thalassiosira profunda]
MPASAMPFVEFPGITGGSGDAARGGSSNRGGAEGGGSGGSGSIPISHLVNLPPAHPNTKSIVPGPFVVLQGSPGDGMANTIDSVPALPPQTTTASNAAPGVRGTSGGSGSAPSSRRNSIQDRIPSQVLEERECEVAAESDDGDADGDAHVWEQIVQVVREEEDAKPSAAGAATRRGPRPRSDSGTEGGLHLPLGATSPIMQKALGSWGRIAAEEEAAAASFGLPLEDTDASPSNSAFLKRRPTRQPKTSGDASSPPKRRNTRSGSIGEGMSHVHIADESQGQDNNGNDVHSDKSPGEIQSIAQWQKECLQQELSHLDDARQNVQVLMQRRIRSRDQRRQQQAHRSVSPSVTATSASSGSSSDSMSTSSREGSGGNGEAADKGKVESDPLNDVLEALELSQAHREWYQRDGRLVVLDSLPHMSLQGVVAHPLTAAGKPAPGNGDKDVVTLSPGCTVMAEAAFVLDSHTFQVLHPALPNTGNMEDEVRASDPKLTFLKITSPHEGYILSSVHSYPLLLPCLPTTYTNANQWLWRVTCRPDGAYVRQGLELVAEHLGTLPYGTVCGVTKKAVNGMGLNRLKIEAYLDEDAGRDMKRRGSDGNGNDGDAFGMAKYSGYISEFLNPLSGQRGNVVEPIPFPVPALYKVVHPKGCVIRSGVELSTTQIGFAPAGSILSIVGRSYSDHPGHNCIERLRLAGGGGWVSVSLNKRPPGNEELVEMVGVDGSFDPNDPSAFHFESMRKVMDELHANSDAGSGSAGRRVSEGGGEARVSFRRMSSYANLSEIGDDDAEQQSSDGENEAGAGTTGAMGISPRVPTLFRSGVVGGVPAAPGLPAMDAIRESSSDGHHHHSSGPNRCLICLSDERTATIVHGETGHIACCLTCARILKARGDNCPVCRLPIDLVIQQFWA